MDAPATSAGAASTVVPIKEDSPEGPPVKSIVPNDAAARQSAALASAYRRLWWWNFACGCLHLVQAIAALIAAQKVSRIANFKLPLTTLFINYVATTPNGPRLPTQQLNQVGLLPFAATTSGFAWLSAAAHFTVLIFFERYKADLAKGVNRFRWFEYALSSSLMIVLVAMLYGM
jgi:Heliorhodopsin